MEPKTFEYPLTVTIGDTNVEGNVYWTNYCSWFGKARELFLIGLLPPEINVFEYLMERKLAIITCDISMKFIKPTFFTDELAVRINTANFGKCVVDLVTEIVNSKKGDIVASGNQKLAFCSMETQKFVPIPEELRLAAQEYEIASPKKPKELAKV